MNSVVLPTSTTISINSNQSVEIKTQYNAGDYQGDMFISNQPGFTNSFSFIEGQLIGQNIPLGLAIYLNEQGEIIINNPNFEINQSGNLILNT